MDVNIGDTVQIVNGGIDVTNGNHAKSGRYYGEGGPLWATVESITNGWKTGSRYGLPSSVTKVRCSNNEVVVWQVQPEHIASSKIQSSKPETVQKEPAAPPAPPPLPFPDTDSDWNKFSGRDYSGTNDSHISRGYYSPKAGTELWTEEGGMQSSSRTSDGLPGTSANEIQIITDRAIFGINESFTYHNSKGSWRDLSTTEKKNIGSKSVRVDPSAINGATIKTSWQNDQKKRQMLNQDQENIINPSGFPRKAVDASGLIAAKYSYQIIPADPALPKMINLEDKLKEARAVFGIPVHGSNQIARAMKYFMYNRFKTPDTNLAHNKSTTHVFFTRPDLNILNPTSPFQANNQTLNNTETAMVWRRFPELFKLLTDKKRCGDSNNFNMLLSNQCTSFDIQDETLTQNRAGKSWNEYEMVYGDAYSGRTAGEFTCNFTETSDYSIINLIKLWITYIDNVARGAWSPSYDLLGAGGPLSRDSSHVFNKALDYASSVYVFKCGPDGEDILYWTKYYGVFPTNTGAGALSWDIGTPIGDAPKLNIRFGYSYKRDLNPISLIEFNNITGIGDAIPPIAENSFNPNLGHSARPYVGAPFIEMKLGDTNLLPDTVDSMRYRTELRLKFLKESSPKLTDDLLYRYSMSGREIDTLINVNPSKIKYN